MRDRAEFVDYHCSKCHKKMGSVLTIEWYPSAYNNAVCDKCKKVKRASQLDGPQPSKLQ